MKTERQEEDKETGRKTMMRNARLRKLRNTDTEVKKKREQKDRKKEHRQAEGLFFMMLSGLSNIWVHNLFCSVVQIFESKVLGKFATI